MLTHPITGKLLLLGLQFAPQHAVSQLLRLARVCNMLSVGSRLLCRMLTHPVTGKPLLLGPAVDANSNRLYITSFNTLLWLVFVVDAGC
jgi:hypothetical protein